MDAEARPDDARDRVADPRRAPRSSTSASTSSASARGRDDYGQLHETDLQVTADTRGRAAAAARPLPGARTGNTRRRLARAARRASTTRLARVGQRRRRRRRRLAGRDRRGSRREVWEVVRRARLGADGRHRERLGAEDLGLRPRVPPSGRSLGTATQIGISLGVALAHKGTGRLVVDLQPDGDLMFDARRAVGRRPTTGCRCSSVMFNNRAYYNDWEHQERIARQRGTDVEPRLHRHGDRQAGARLRGGRRVRSAGTAEGPIEDPDAVAGARSGGRPNVVRAEGRPALVDVVCQYD